MEFVINKRFFVLSIILLLAVNNIKGQQDSSYQRRPREAPKNNWLDRNRFYWGGNLGAWFGNPSFADVSPLVGYKITDKLSVGVGVIFNYYSYKYNNYKYSTTFYGGRINARYFILENVFVQAGYDRINRDDPYSYKPNSRIWVENILVGGGLRYPVSDQLYCTATALWNLNDTPLSPYPNPIIQVGFIGRF
jgi:hypothetical protein